MEEEQEKLSSQSNNEEEQIECFFCKMGREQHSPTFVCHICYNDRKVSSKTETQCENNCVACKPCVTSSITAQFDLARINAFKCICGGANIKEELLEPLLGQSEMERLQRIRESRDIDQDPNAIRCPNVSCQKKVVRDGKEAKLTCELCNQESCFDC